MSEEIQPQRPWYRLTVWECVAIVAIAGTLILLLRPAVQYDNDSGRRERCRTNLKMLGLALRLYHDAHGSFPPAYIADAAGRPMHSWRVLILPYLNQQALFNRYRFDEPWDGPRNSRLHDEIVAAFVCPTEAGSQPPHDRRTTSYVAVIGNQTAWPENRCTKRDDFTDGLDKTLHVVEVANSGIHWMEPRDLHVTQMARTINPAGGYGISSLHKRGAEVLLADGSAHYLPATMPADQLRALLTIGAEDDPGEF